MQLHAWGLELPRNRVERARRRLSSANRESSLGIAKLSPKGYEEVSRWKMQEPTSKAFGRDVVWSHPAYANRCCFARNDKEMVCVGLGK